MFWALVAVGFVGLTVGITCTVHIMVLVSIVAVALMVIVAFQAGLSLLMGCAAIGSALVILQVCYLIGACVGANVRSAKDADPGRIRTRAAR